MKNQSQSRSIKEEHQCFKAKLKQNRNFLFRKIGLENSKETSINPPIIFRRQLFTT